mgnify:CR=1 FL=1
MSIDMTQIYSEYRGKVMSNLWARINNRAEAEDLCSEVFKKILRKAEGYDETKAALRTWSFPLHATH